MKSTKKILAVILALVLSLSAFSVVAMAGPEDPVQVTVDITTTKTDKVSTKGDPVYQVDAYIDSSHSLTAFQLRITFDKNYFYAVNSKTLGFMPAPGEFAAITDAADDNIFSPNSTVYTNNEFCADGYYMGPDCSPADGYSIYASSSAPSITKCNSADLALPNNYVGFALAQKANYGDSYLLVSGGHSSGNMASPTRGRVKVFSAYIAPKATTPDGSYTIGIQPGQDGKFGGAYCINDVVDTKSVGDMKYTTKSVRPENVTINSATITLGEVAPTTGKLTKTAAFVKEVNGDAFKLKVRSSITEADMNELLAAKSLADVKTGVTSVGFVVTNDATWTEAEAVKAIKGEALTGSARYAAGKTNVVYQADGKYNFGAILDSSRTNLGDGVKYRAFIEFADGSYEFYAADETLTAAQVNQALGTK